MEAERKKTKIKWPSENMACNWQVMYCALNAVDI